MKIKKIIYVYLDGVLVDTPKFINKEIQIKDNFEKTCKEFSWDYVLKNCNEIKNNMKILKKISRKNEIVNLKENILIDDCSKNVDKWINSGGTWIEFDNEMRIDKLLTNYINI